jgi:hypothetical protein
MELALKSRLEDQGGRVAFKMGGLWILMAFNGGACDGAVEVVLQVERLEVGAEVEFERVEKAGENGAFGILGLGCCCR